MTDRVRIEAEIDVDILQNILREWPGVGDAAEQLGKTRQTVHNMLRDGRLRGIETAVGWIIHPDSLARALAQDGRGAPGRG